MPIERLEIPDAILNAILAHAEAEAPLECCALIGGVWQDGVGIAKLFLPLVNKLASPVAYEAEVKSLLAAHRELRAASLVEVAVVHSHPTSAPIPSKTDLARNGYGGDIVHVIVGQIAGEWGVRAWVLAEPDFREVVLN